MSFPKLIHLMWFQGVANAPDGLSESPGRWAQMNPGWEVRTWDEHNTRKFILEFYPDWLGEWDALPSVIKKCDLARLLIIHKHGGLYADLDLLPMSSLDAFLRGGVRRYQSWTLGQRTLTAKQESPEFVDYLGAELILSREYRPIDAKGHGIANGFILAKQGSDFLMKFMLSRRGSGDEEVLKAFGPWALTYFIRDNFQEAKAKVRVMPPMYFLWEDPAFDQEPPSWVVCKHLAKNYWGDHTKKHWWRTS